MKEFDANRTINGTYGEAWFDDDYLAEVTSGKAEVDITYTDIQRARHIINGKKMAKAEGKGSIKINHVRSNIASKVSDAVKTGKTPSFKIVMNLDDPDAYGSERVVLYGCKFSKAILMDWEGGKTTEESYDFTFEDWDFIDSIIM